MAKRQRGGARPGQRSPLQRGGRPAAQSRPAAQPRPATPPGPSGSLSEDELARAAELEAQLVAEASAADTSRSRRDRRREAPATPAGSRGRGSAVLVATSEEEYRYVTGDLRKIAVVFTLVFGLLVASWLLIVVSGVVDV